MNAVDKATNEAIPALAAAALGAGGGMDPDVKAMLTELLKESFEKRQKEKEKQIARAMAGAQAAKEHEEQVRRIQGRCTHRKQNGATRLAGQRITGTGQISLVCQFCSKTFFLPALEGQNPVPPELMPNGDEIGG